ncbi:MAG: RNase adapter RapZ [Paracoccaceae bacterium]
MPEAPPRGAAPAVVFVAGLSGAGRTTAIKALEDLGFEAIDNFPLPLVETLVAGGGLERPLALGIESRTRGFTPRRLGEIIARLRGRLDRAQVVLVFLDSDDETLARRFSETRRRHPLSPAEDVETGIARERDLMADLRADADMVIDTSPLGPHELKREMAWRFAPAAAGATGAAAAVGGGPTVTVNSFSYRRGVPQGCDVVVDVRFLQNPYWVASLRPRDGRDPAVQAHVAADPRYGAFFDRLSSLLLLLLPAYAEAGKIYFSVALGCTGGRHRSVTVAERLARRLTAAGWPAGVRHRELEREAARTGRAAEGGG